MREYVVTYLGELVRLTNEMAPYLLLGFFFAGVLRVVLPGRVIAQTMGRRNFRSVLNASLLGVPMPLCSCGVLPAGIGFYRNGATRGSTVSFLISTPQTGVDSILATYSLLGLPLAVIRPVVALVTGVLGGMLGNLADGNGTTGQPRVTGGEETHDRSVRELFRYGFVELLQDISKWLIIGMLVAALLAVLIPDEFFTSYVSSEYLAMLIMILASVPLYICATGSIPIAAVLLMKGLSPGAALVLLMAGPATNIATMAVIGNTMGRKTLWVYLVSIVGGAMLFGTLVNELLPREWIMNAIPTTLHEGLHGVAGNWYRWIFSASLVLLIINGQVMKLVTGARLKREDLKKSRQMEINIHRFKVEGMTCNHCKATVENGLKDLTPVTEVVADPSEDLVTVQAASISEEEIKKTIERLGYRYGGRA